MSNHEIAAIIQDYKGYAVPIYVSTEPIWTQ